MHYYIDGYNYVFRYKQADDDLQGQRQKFLTDLNAKVKLLGLDATIVFDAQYEASDFSRAHYDSLEIIFTAYGEIADELILQELKNSKMPNLHTVVTSDKRLSAQVRSLNAHVETIEAFFGELNKRVKNKIRHSKSPKETKKIRESQVIKKLCTEYEIKKASLKIQTPDPKATISESFAYYLETFEKRYLEELNLAKPKIKNKKQK
jgi:predicted RNA-binding protein with PIN domain